MRKALLLIISFAFISTSHSAAQVRPIRGFPDDAVAAERQREEQFRKVPDSARLKEYAEKKPVPARRKRFRREDWQRKPSAKAAKNGKQQAS